MVTTVASEVASVAVYVAWQGSNTGGGSGSKVGRCGSDSSGDGCHCGMEDADVGPKLSLQWLIS
jgi:hypothetical protein